MPWDTSRPFEGMPYEIRAHSLYNEALRLQDHPWLLIKFDGFKGPFATRKSLGLMKTLVVQTQIVRFLLVESLTGQQIQLPPGAPDDAWLPILHLFAERCERWKTDLVGVPNCCEIIVRDFLEEIEDWMPGDVLIPQQQEVPGSHLGNSLRLDNREQKGTPSSALKDLPKRNKKNLELCERIEKLLGKNWHAYSTPELFKRCKPHLSDWGFKPERNAFRHRIDRLKKVPRNSH